MRVDLNKEISEILISCEDELKQMQKKIDDPEEKLTEQFVGDVVGNLRRREHALKHRLHGALTQNTDFNMPLNWTARVLQQIEAMLSDNSTKAKIEMLAGSQAAFWGVLQDIKEVLIKPTEVSFKVTRVEPSEDHYGGGAGR